MVGLGGGGGARLALGHLGPAVIRGRLRLVSPFVSSSASCSSCSVVLRIFCCLFFAIYVLSLSGLRFVVSLSVLVLALSLSLSLCSLCLLFVLSSLLFSSLLLSCLLVFLSCLVWSLCRLGGLLRSCLVVLGLFGRLFGSLGGRFGLLGVFFGGLGGSWSGLGAS